MDKILGLFEDKKPTSQVQSDNDNMFSIFKKKPEPAKKP